MRVVFRIEKPCLDPSHEEVRIVHSDKKHGLKKWTREDTELTHYSGLNLFVLDVYLPVGGKLWFKLTVYDVLREPVHKHVEEFDRSLNLCGGARLVDVKYDENIMGIRYIEQPYNIDVSIKDIGMFEPKPGGWNMTDDDLRPDQYHRAEYSSVGCNIRCGIIDPPRPKFAEFEKNVHKADKQNGKPPDANSTVAGATDMKTELEAEVLTEPEAEKGGDKRKFTKSSKRKLKKHKKNSQHMRSHCKGDMFEHLFLQASMFLENYSRSISGSRSVTTGDDGCIGVKPSAEKVKLYTDTNSSNEAFTSLLSNGKGNPINSTNSNIALKAEQIKSDVIASSSNEAFKNELSGVNVTSSENVPKVTKRDVGTRTSMDGLMVEKLKIDVNNNMVTNEKTVDRGPIKESLALIWLECALTIGLSGVVCAFVLLRK